MLSQDLRSLRQRLEEYRHGGVQLTSDEVEAFHRNLTACEEQARHLERGSAPVNGQLTQEHLADGKIELFPIAARRRPAKSALAAPPPNGGDVA